MCSSDLSWTGGSGGSGIVIISIPAIQNKVASFTGTSTWTVPTGVTTVQYLVVAGGGGADAAGGGAGGFRTGSGLSVTPGQTYNAVIGAGGICGGGNGGLPQTNGSNSGFWGAAPFPAIWSTGGGYGGTSYHSPRGAGNSGGSGGRGGVVRLQECGDQEQQHADCGAGTESS